MSGLVARDQCPGWLVERSSGVGWLVISALVVQSSSVGWLMISVFVERSSGVGV